MSRQRIHICFILQFLRKQEKKNIYFISFLLLECSFVLVYPARDKIKKSYAIYQFHNAELKENTIRARQDLHVSDFYENILNILPTFID